LKTDENIRNLFAGACETEDVLIYCTDETW